MISNGFGTTWAGWASNDSLIFKWAIHIQSMKNVTNEKFICQPVFTVSSFRARKDSEVALDAQKYVALVRVLSKHGKLEG